MKMGFKHARYVCTLLSRFKTRRFIVWKAMYMSVLVFWTSLCGMGRSWTRTKRPIGSLTLRHVQVGHVQRLQVQLVPGPQAAHYPAVIHEERSQLLSALPVEGWESVSLRMLHDRPTCTLIVSPKVSHFSVARVVVPSIHNSGEPTQHMGVKPHTIPKNG